MCPAQHFIILLSLHSGSVAAAFDADGGIGYHLDELADRFERTVANQVRRSLPDAGTASASAVQRPSTLVDHIDHRPPSVASNASSNSTSSTHSHSRASSCASVSLNTTATSKSLFLYYILNNSMSHNDTG